MSITEKRGKSPPDAVAVLLEKIHRLFPTGSTRPIPPYGDEDFTLEIKLPADMELLGGKGRPTAFTFKTWKDKFSEVKRGFGS